MNIKKPTGYDENPDYYVYAHLHPKTNDVFYIGKGKGNRAFEKVSRNNAWYKFTESLVQPYKVLILKDNLSEFMAETWEERLIEKFGTIHDGGILVNSTGSKIHPMMGVSISVGEPEQPSHKWEGMHDPEIIDDLLSFPNWDDGEDIEAEFEALYDIIYDRYDEFEDENGDAVVDVENEVCEIADFISIYKHSCDKNAREELRDNFDVCLDALQDVLDKEELTEEFENYIEDIRIWLRKCH